MSTNSAQMTLEEKVVQKLKDVHLGSMITDEEDLEKLVRRAITEQLFNSKVERTSTWGQREIVDTIIVRTAKQVVEQAAKQLIEKEVEVLKNSEEFRKCLTQLLSSYIPVVLGSHISNSFAEMLRMNLHSSVEAMRNTLGNIAMNGNPTIAPNVYVNDPTADAQRIILKDVEYQPEIKRT